MSVRNAVRKATEKRPTGRPKSNVRSYYVGNGRLSESGVYVSDSARRLGGLRARGSAVGNVLGLGFRALPSEQLDSAVERLKDTVASLPDGSPAAPGYREALEQATGEQARRHAAIHSDSVIARPEAAPTMETLAIGMDEAKALFTEAAMAALRADPDAPQLAADALAAIATARGKGAA